MGEVPGVEQGPVSFLPSASDVFGTSLSCVMIWTEGGAPEPTVPGLLLPEKPGFGEMLSYGGGGISSRS